MTGSRHLSCSFWLYFDVTMYTAISRKVVRKIVHATIPKGDVGYDQYTVPVVPDTVAIESTFVAFLKHSQTDVHGLKRPFFRFKIF